MAGLLSLSAADFARLTTNIAPTGDAWPTEPDAVQQQVYLALSAVWAALQDRANYLVTDIFPATSVETLPEWEYTLGLPDPCAGPDPTVAQRQAHVVARLTQQNGPSIPSLTAFAAALGYTITIQEFRPSIAGRMRAGDRTARARWAHVWQITAPATVVNYFRGGSGRAGDRLTSWGSSVLECEMQRIKPAHTVLMFDYVGTPAAAVLGGFVLGRDVLGTSTILTGTDGDQLTLPDGLLWEAPA